jgi:hypothetical protein
VKVKCVMRNEWIYGLTTNHSFAPLPEQERMWALDVEEMKSPSKIDLKDVLWWMSIKDVYRLGASITTRFSKEGCNSLAIGGRPLRTTCKHD